jgi:hypothetical protein
MCGHHIGLIYTVEWKEHESSMIFLPRIYQGGHRGLPHCKLWTHSRTIECRWELNNKFEICILFQIWSRLTHWVSLFNIWIIVACLKGIVNAISHCHWHALSNNFVVVEVEFIADFVVTIKFGWMLIVYQWLHIFCNMVIVDIAILASFSPLSSIAFQP